MHKRVVETLVSYHIKKSPRDKIQEGTDFHEGGKKSSG
jgi:hypothetical protein